MLISELRELIKKYKEEDLRLLIAEMYKAMPKKLREEKSIDTLLYNPNVYSLTGKGTRKQHKQIDLKFLIPEIEQFIDYAYKQYYFAPNSYIHKKERPKWRFKVKFYINSLQSIPIDGEEGKIATNLLIKLYEMLCYASRYYIFSTDDPFRSVGIEQTVLIDNIINRRLGSGINSESVRNAIELVIDSSVDREILHSFLIDLLVENLKTNDSKEIAIEQSMFLKAGLDNSKSKSSKRSRISAHSEYQLIDKINLLVRLVFRLNVALCEYDTAIKYFSENYVEKDKEASLNVLLDHLYEFGLKNHWLREYDRAVKKGVKPREELQRIYQYIQQTDMQDQLPERSFFYFRRTL